MGCPSQGRAGVFSSTTRSTLSLQFLASRFHCVRIHYFNKLHKNIKLLSIGRYSKFSRYFILDKIMPYLVHSGCAWAPIKDVGFVVCDTDHGGVG